MILLAPREFGFSESRFRVLIHADADINVKNNLGRSLLSYASECNSPLLTKELLRLNADVNSQDNQGDTPLMHAVYNEQEQIVNELINHKNIKGKTALDLAKTVGGKTLTLIVNALLDNGIKNIH